MFMVERSCGHDIEYDTRDNVDSLNITDPLEVPPLPEIAAENETLEFVFAQVIGDLMKGFFNLGPEEQNEMKKKMHNGLGKFSSWALRGLNNNGSLIKALNNDLFQFTIRFHHINDNIALKFQSTQS